MAVLEVASDMRPRVLRWYAALAVVQLLVAIVMLSVGLLSVLAMIEDPSFGPWMPAFAVTVGAVYTAIYAASLVPVRAAWRWWVAAVGLVLATFNGLLVIPAIVILAVWVRAETRDYFGVRG